MSRGQSVECRVWIVSCPTATRDLADRYTLKTRRFDQDFRFPELNDSFRAITGRKYHPKRELTSGSFRPGADMRASTLKAGPNHL